jgi:hypothetical protein
LAFKLLHRGGFINIDIVGDWDTNLWISNIEDSTRWWPTSVLSDSRKVRGMFLGPHSKWTILWGFLTFWQIKCDPYPEQIIITYMSQYDQRTVKTVACWRWTLKIGANIIVDKTTKLIWYGCRYHHTGTRRQPLLPWRSGKTGKNQLSPFLPGVVEEKRKLLVHGILGVARVNSVMRLAFQWSQIATLRACASQSNSFRRFRAFARRGLNFSTSG